ncbi:MAG: hypothetical protein HQL11_06455, partial [Candidatus Omnitrophica bacterium]|nr:hypothetical protein [Candidatus Omnitrophota bacterium]
MFTQSIPRKSLHPLIALVVFGVLSVSQTAFAEVVIKVMAVNPSKERKQEIPIRAYLPKEIKPEHVINREEFSIDYDTERSLYLAVKDVMLDPLQSYTLVIRLEDIWCIPTEKITELTERADKAMQALRGSALEDVATMLYQNVGQG